MSAVPSNRVAYPNAYGMPVPPPPPPGYATPYLYAGLGTRFGAALLDLIVLLLVTIVVAIPFGLMAGAIWLAGGSSAWAFVSAWLAGPFTLLLFAVWILYYTYFEGTSGQTPGKRAMGIRVVELATGRPPTFGRALLRSVLRIVDWLPGLYLLGFVVALLTPNKQRIGDVVAETIVIRA